MNTQHRAQRISEALHYGKSRSLLQRFSMDNYINKSALVEVLGISTRTLENWCAHRSFPKARRLTGSRLIFFCVAEVEAWLEQALETEGQQ